MNDSLKQDPCVSAMIRGTRGLLLGLFVAFGISPLARAAEPAAASAKSDAGLRAFLAKVTVHKSTLTIPAGSYTVAGRAVEVRQSASFGIASAEIVSVENEALKLSKDKPGGWAQGTRLRSVAGGGGLNAYRAFVAGSLVIRRTPDGEPLAEGKDYLVSPEFGMVGIGPDACVTPEDTVYASYRYGLLRIDSVFVDRLGRPILVKGTPDIVVPRPPEITWDGVRLCNIFRPYGARELTTEHLFPILETATMAPTRTTRGRLPRALKKIEANKLLTIVCLGDSVTQGGDASRASRRYVDRFRTQLADGFDDPVLKINVVNISYGGTASRQWLRLEPFTDAWFAATPHMPADEITFERVEALKPDVLTIEFVNDAYLDEATFEATYSTILERVKPFGTEIVLITPHFTTPDWMGMKTLREAETRPYVHALYRFAEKHQLAVADASARWAHLWKEGLPYVTLLKNTLNHPDDRGHQLFADELLKCFEPATTTAPTQD
ncbi:MAG: hypothetical protein JXA69_10445 [Phycisphaerae bacterium]|nr:hypothetical protein [Phycisphaerae bacterium]